MNRGTSVLAVMGLTAAMLLTSACGAITSMVGGGGAAANALWSDVPQMPGMTKQSGELPLPVKLAMQAMMQGMSSAESGSVENVEFLTFTTAKTPEDLRAFYSKDAMNALGWNLPDVPGCTGAAAGAQGVAIPGEFCIYGRDAGNGKNTFLIVMAVKEDGKAESTVYFYRISGVKVNVTQQ